MPEWNTINGATAALAILISLGVAAVLLRSACDLTGMDPAPTFARSAVLTLVLVGADIPIAYGLHRLVPSFAPGLGIAPSEAWMVMVGLNLGVLLVMGAAMLMPILPAKPGRALRVMSVFLLLCSLVGSVAGLLIVGIGTLFGAMSRLS